MTIQQAIEKAIEGGWGTGYMFNIRTGDDTYGFSEPHSREELEKWNKEHPKLGGKIVAHEITRGMENAVFLDPLFWQSLGKAMGWGWRCSYCNGHFDKEKGHNDGGKLYPEANKKWHHFIDHLAEGKDAGSFFEKL